MSRDLTNLVPASTYQYLIQTDFEDSSSSLLTASLQNGLGVSVDTLLVTASHALTASNISGANNVYYSDVLVTGSVQEWYFTGSGITVEETGSGKVLITVNTGSGGEEIQNLQDVTTLGNTTSQSIDINGGVANTTGSYTLTNGQNVTAIGDYSHAEGSQTTAIGVGSHAEGFQTIVIGDYSHTEGQANTSVGIAVHTEGLFTTANGTAAHAEGGFSLAASDYTHAEGVGTTAGSEGAHAEGQASKALGIYSHAEGSQTTTKGFASHTEGWGTISNASYQSVTGRFNQQSSTAYWIIGNGAGDTLRSNLLEAHQSRISITGSLFVKGIPGVGGDNLIHLRPGTNVTITSGSTGYTINAAGGTEVDTLQSVTTRGNQTSRSIDIWDGVNPNETGSYTLTHGRGVTASGLYSHAEGFQTTALGTGSHAEGANTKALGNYSHAEGDTTTAIGVGSHTEGSLTIASGNYQTVIGKWNKVPVNDGSWMVTSFDGAFIVGNGDANTRQNGLAVFRNSAGNSVIQIENIPTANYVGGAGSSVPIGGIYSVGGMLCIKE